MGPRLTAVDLTGALRGLDGSTLTGPETAVVAEDQAILVAAAEAFHIDVKACALRRPDGTDINTARIVVHVEPAVPTTVIAEYEDAAVMAESLGVYLRAGFERIGGLTEVRVAPPATRMAHRILITVTLANLVEAHVGALALTSALLEAHPTDFVVEPEDVD